MTDVFERIAARLGPQGVVRDSADQAPYLNEWRGRYDGRTPFIAAPASTEETADVVRLCAEARIAITPQGGNTGLVGGQIPDGEVLLSMKRMNAIRSLDAKNDSLVAEAGAVLADVQTAAADSQRLFPLSLASEGSATIGGLISTNAGGVHVMRYGMMRELVLGLEAVLPDGRVFHGLSGLRKDNTGYDLKQLFIGAEGTLGIVTAASLKLFARPSARETIIAAVGAPADALALLHLVKQATGAVSAFEIMNRAGIDMAVKNVSGARDPVPGAAFAVLIEFEAFDAEGLRDSVEKALGAALDQGLISDALMAENSSQTRAFWALREALPAGHRREGAQTNHDVSVPVSSTPLLFERTGEAVERLCPGARIVAFGHMGDGNIHYSALQPEAMAPERFPRAEIAEAIHEAAAALGGSISAEHGIGVARKHDFARYEHAESVALMRVIKRAIDPDNIMNPRVLFD